MAEPSVEEIVAVFEARADEDWRLTRPETVRLIEAWRTAVMNFAISVDYIDRLLDERDGRVKAK